MRKIEKYGQLTVSQVSDGGNAQRLEALSRLGQAASNASLGLMKDARKKQGLEEGALAGRTAQKYGEKVENKTGMLGLSNSYSNAFNQSQQASYLASLDVDAISKVNELSSKHGDDPAAFRTNVEAYRESVLKNIPADYAPVVQESFDRMFARTEANINQNILKKAEEERKAQMNLAQETYSKEALRAVRNNDPEAFEENMLKFNATVDARPDLTEADKIKLKMEKRTELRTQAYRADILETAEKNYSAAEKKFNELDNDKVPEGYDPDEWEIVKDGIRTDLNRRKPKEGGSKKATSAIKDIQERVAAGFLVDAEEFLTLRRELTSDDDIAKLDDIRQTQKFLSLPEDSRNAVLDQLSKSDIPEHQTKYLELAKTNESFKRLEKDDPMLVAERQRKIELAPIYTESGKLDITARLQQTEELNLAAGGSIFKQSEMKQIVKDLETMSYEEQAEILSVVGNNAAAYSQIDKAGAPQKAMIAATKDKDLMEAVLKGEDLIKSKQVKPANRAEFNAVADDYLGLAGDLYGVEDRATIIDAAINYLAGQGKQGDDISDKDMKKAFEKITGGVTEINDRKVEVPRDLEIDEFEDYIDDLSIEDIEYHGGFSPRYKDTPPLSRLVPRPLGDGQYVLTYSGADLLNKEDKKLIIKIDRDEFSRQQVIKRTNSRYGISFN